MRKRLILIAAATTALVAVAAVLAVRLLPGHPDGRPGPSVNPARAQELTEQYRRDTVARIPAGLSYAEAVRGYVACPGQPGRFELSSRFDLRPDSGPAIAFTALREHWQRQGYRVLNDTSTANGQLLVENPADGFRLGVSQRATRYIRVAISSPCLDLGAPPLPPVLAQDLASALGAYEEYAAARLAELAGDVTALRAAVVGGDVARARAAWLVARMRWARVGAAYGTFDDLADAIGGLPVGPPDPGDPDFTGLHRIEYGLWHGEDPARLLTVVDGLAADVGRLRDTLHEVLPAPADLPLRAHEILEDALRDELTGLTEFGGGAGLAATWAGVDATAALLDLLAPLLDARRPALRPAIRTGLDALRQALQPARSGEAWSAPDAVAPPVRRRIDAALGGVLETLAQVPGLLEGTAS
ncbi:EfeM/EfeO family lipoprotein [Dactylosporangium sp. NPDC049140]|uniref:EfeM/EfeO family lipoprotein n=1 Tax=Dactylosporangium sp. NPDC049140 TaxID=3155647 RepID=UPI0033C6226D